MRPTLVALATVACTADAPDPTARHASPLAPPPGVPLALSVGQLEAGSPLSIVISDADPGEEVRLIRSTGGMGVGPCPPVLGGMCVDVVPSLNIMGPFTADGAGMITLDPNIPAALALGTDVCFQAVAARGAGGVDSVKSPVSCRKSDWGPVSLNGGINTGDDFADGWVTGGNAHLARRFDAPSTIDVGWVEFFTGQSLAVPNTAVATIWSHNGFSDEPDTAIATTTWTSTGQAEWQGGALDASVLMVAGETYWVSLWLSGGGQTSRQDSGTSVSYMGLTGSSTSWSGPFTNFEKFKLCGGGGCPD